MISFDEKSVLGEGRKDTIVFKGKFKPSPSSPPRDVAVKRILTSYFKQKDREDVMNLRCDGNQNVIRYYGTEQKGPYTFFALDLCAATLDDLIKGKWTHPKLQSRQSHLKIVKGAFKGINHLHTLHLGRIVHNDVKPRNILISIANGNESPRGIISDLGLSNQLDLYRDSITVSNQKGTPGFMAPEYVIWADSEDDAGKPKVSWKADIFSSGVLLAYERSNGKHPFGLASERDMKIKACDKIRPTLEDLDPNEDCTIRNLIEKMIEFNPNQRPPMKAVLTHPSFWDIKKILQFFQTASDNIHPLKESHPLIVAIEKGFASVIPPIGSPPSPSTNWHSNIPEMTKKLTEGRYKKLDGTKLKSLLRYIRNYSHHYHEKTEKERNTYGVKPDDFVSYFNKTFPNLFVYIFKIMESYKCVPDLEDFYDENYNWG